jgi:ABC-type nitrate/sulfonate/bicarbonate transport system permease component
MIESDAPETPGATIGRSASRLLLFALTRAGSILVLLLGWEILARSGVLTPFLLPKFTVVLERIASEMASGVWFTNVGITLYRALVGFLAAAAIGVPLGMLMARFKPVHWFFDPVVSVGFPVPKIAFLPVFILWFDLFDTAKIIMIAFESIFPIIAASWAGTFTVERHLVWSARSLGASHRQVLTEIVLPAAMPHILTGLQIALPMALIIALVTEFVMGGSGLGADMTYALRYGDSPGVFAGIVSIALIGYAVMKMMGCLRRRLLAWHAEAEADG